MTVISNILKYWKFSGAVILTLGFLVCFHLAKSRGEKLNQAMQTLEGERKDFATKLKLIEKAVQDEKERQNFRTKQNKRIKLAAGPVLQLGDDPGAAYQRLRERQAGRNRG